MEQSTSQSRSQDLLSFLNLMTIFRSQSNRALGKLDSRHRSTNNILCQKCLYCEVQMKHDALNEEAGTLLPKTTKANDLKVLCAI